MLFDGHISYTNDASVLTPRDRLQKLKKIQLKIHEIGDGMILILNACITEGQLFTSNAKLCTTLLLMSQHITPVLPALITPPQS